MIGMMSIDLQGMAAAAVPGFLVQHWVVLSRLHKQINILPQKPREEAGTPGYGVLLLFLGMVRAQMLLGARAEGRWRFVFLLLMHFIV